jgi:hypothetical protein
MLLRRRESEPGLELLYSALEAQLQPLVLRFVFRDPRDRQ